MKGSKESESVIVSLPESAISKIASFPRAPKRIRQNFVLHQGCQNTANKNITQITDSQSLPQSTRQAYMLRKEKESQINVEILEESTEIAYLVDEEDRF